MVRILVVGDEELVRDFIGRVLRSGGWPDVTLAGSGPEALHHLHRDRYALCITDLRLPGMDGIELLRKVTEEGITTDFLFLTGYGTIESAVAATKLGAQDFLEKPTRPARLIAIIRRILRRHQPVPHVLAERMDLFLANHIEAPDLGVADLCRQFKISTRHVSCVFHDHLHTTVPNRIAHHRVARGKQLLADTRHSIQHIATTCGFSDYRRLQEALTRGLMRTYARWFTWSGSGQQNRDAAAWFTVRQRHRFGVESED